MEIQSLMKSSGYSKEDLFGSDYERKKWFEEALKKSPITSNMSWEEVKRSVELISSMGSYYSNMSFEEYKQSSYQSQQNSKKIDYFQENQNIINQNNNNLNQNQYLQQNQFLFQQQQSQPQFQQQFYPQQQQFQQFPQFQQQFGQQMQLTQPQFQNMYPYQQQYQQPQQQQFYQQQPYQINQPMQQMQQINNYDLTTEEISNNDESTTQCSTQKTQNQKAKKPKKTLQNCCKCRSGKDIKKRCGSHCKCYKNYSQCDEICQSLGCGNKQYLIPLEQRKEIKKQGCSCTKTQCADGNCDCKKRGQKCGDHCACIKEECINLDEEGIKKHQQNIKSGSAISEESEYGEPLKKSFEQDQYRKNSDYQRELEEKRLKAIQNGKQIIRNSIDD